MIKLNPKPVAWEVPCCQNTIQEDTTQLGEAVMMCWKEQTGILLNNQCQLASSVKVMHGSLSGTDRTVDKKSKNRHVIFVVNVKMVLY